MQAQDFYTLYLTFIRFSDNIYYTTFILKVLYISTHMHIDNRIKASASTIHSEAL